LKVFALKLKTLFRLAAVYTGLAGLGFVFAPQAFGAGALPDDAPAALIAYVRLFGCPLLGIAVLNWMAGNTGPSSARNAIILGNIVGFGTMAAVDVWGVLSGARQIQKLFGVIHLLFAVAFVWIGRKGIVADASE
jgi:hypothetical protein